MYVVCLFNRKKEGGRVTTCWVRGCVIDYIRLLKDKKKKEEEEEDKIE